MRSVGKILRSGETRRDEYERKRNDKRREKYARLHEQQRTEADEPQEFGRRGSSGKKAKQSRKQFDKRQGAPSSSAKPTRESSAVSQTTVKAAATGVPIAMDTMTGNKVAESASTARRFA